MTATLMAKVAKHLIKSRKRTRGVSKKGLTNVGCLENHVDVRAGKATTLHLLIANSLTLHTYILP